MVDGSTCWQVVRPRQGNIHHRQLVEDHGAKTARVHDTHEYRIMYVVHCTLNTARFTLHTPHNALYTVTAHHTLQAVYTVFVLTKRSKGQGQALGKSS